MKASFKHYLLAAAAGAVATLALPPLYLVPALAVSFPALLLLLDKCRSGRQAFFTGWWFGFAHHVTGLYWLAYPLLVDAERFAWLIPFAISFIPAYLALYTGAVGWMTFRSKRDGWRRVVLFACFWTLAEIARAYLFTGFPWNLTGYVWMDVPLVAQGAALVGVYGLSLLTVLIFSAPLLLTRESKALELAVILWTIVIAVWQMQDHTPPAGNGEESFKVRVVQPNIEQRMKWDSNYAMDGLMKHLELTRQPYDGAPPNVVVWPESAIPFRLQEDASLRRVIAEALPPDAVLLIGGVREEQGNTYNSLMVIDDTGEILTTYDKHHLVPFGEYIPLRFLFPFIDKLTEGGMDFSAGEGAQTIAVEGVPPFSPLICYEGIFSGRVKDAVNPPAWMVNITNDAWFGDSTGPRQHLAMVKMRAIEEGIPMVRAANTGISYANGRQIALNQIGVLDENIVYTAPGHLTPYSRYGILIPLVLAALMIAAAWRKGS